LGEKTKEKESGSRRGEKEVFTYIREREMEENEEDR
jgi:hypothetical protein